MAGENGLPNRTIRRTTPRCVWNLAQRIRYTPDGVVEISAVRRKADF